MGFFSKIRSIASKAKCSTGFHVGHFRPISGQPECHLERTCIHCNKHQNKVQHSYSNWEYVRDESCMKVHHCEYCESSEEKEFHEDYQKEGKDSDCAIIEKCVRCDHESIGRVEHDFEEMQKDSHCIIKEKCIDCGSERELREEHDWIEMYDGDDEDTRDWYSCDYCHKEEMR